MYYIAFTGIIAFIVMMLVLGAFYASILPVTSSSLTNIVTVLGFIVAIGAILTKLR